MIIAVDFDGCIVTNAWPKIGKPDMAVVNALKARRLAGAKLILWTCRSGKRLDEAVRFCESMGLVFDAVNEDIAQLTEGSRKVYANEYWDDRAFKVRAGSNRPAGRSSPRNAVDPL